MVVLVMQAENQTYVKYEDDEKSAIVHAKPDTTEPLHISPKMMAMKMKLKKFSIAAENYADTQVMI